MCKLGVDVNEYESREEMLNGVSGIERLNNFCGYFLHMIKILVCVCLQFCVNLYIPKKPFATLVTSDQSQSKTPTQSLSLSVGHKSSGTRSSASSSLSPLLLLTSLLNLYLYAAVLCLMYSLFSN